MMEPELGLGFFQSRTPDSVTHHFIRLPLGFRLNGECWPASVTADTRKGVRQACVKKDLAFSLVLEKFECRG